MKRFWIIAAVLLLVAPAALAQEVNLRIGGETVFSKTIDPPISPVSDDPFLVNIEEFGCRGNDPSFDNSLPLNKLMQRCERRELTGIICIPGKAFFIQNTVVLPPITGLRIQGTGLCSTNAESQYSPAKTPEHRPTGGPGSRLVWNGPTDRGHAMLHYRSAGLRLDGVTLQGAWDHGLRKKVTSNPRAPIGLLIDQAADPPIGMGTGHCYIGALAVIGCQVGVQFGNSDLGDHADNTRFSFLETSYCDVGVKYVNHQAVGTSYGAFFPYMCKVGIDVVSTARAKGPGKLNITQVSHVSPGLTMLRLAGVSRTTATFRIDDYILDPNAKGGMIVDMLESPSTQPAHISIRGHSSFDGYPDKPLFRLRGPATLDLDWYYAENGMAECHEQGGSSPLMLLSNTRFKVGDSPEKFAIGSYKLKYTNAHDHNAGLLHGTGDGLVTGDER